MTQRKTRWRRFVAWRKAMPLDLRLVTWYVGWRFPKLAIYKNRKRSK